MEKTISTITAYIAVDNDGQEGIMGAQMGDGMFMPLVGADEARMMEYYPVAVKISELSGHKLPFKILQFSNVEDITEKVIAKMYEPGNWTGMLIDEASERLRVLGIEHRIMEKDGRAMMGTTDFNPKRLNFSIVNNIITDCHTG